MPFPTGIHRQRRQKSCGKGARRVSFEEQQEAVWRVALASYDPREMRVWMRYLEECNPAIRCTGYRTSQTLLRRLEQGDVDVLVLGGRLEDVDSIQFLPRLRGLARKPLVLLRDDGRNEKAAVESLSQEDACYLIRQATLEDMLRELRAPAHSPAESLEKRCERIYRSWGLNTSDANKRYLTGAVRVMIRPPSGYPQGDPRGGGAGASPDHRGGGQCAPAAAGYAGRDRHAGMAGFSERVWPGAQTGDHRPPDLCAGK